MKKSFLHKISSLTLFFLISASIPSFAQIFLIPKNVPSGQLPIKRLETADLIKASGVVEQYLTPVDIGYQIQTVDEAVSTLHVYLKEHPEFISHLALENLQTQYSHHVNATAYRPGMIYVGFVQKYENLTVEKTMVQFAIKLLPEGSKIVLGYSILAPDMQSLLSPEKQISLDVLRSKAKDVLGRDSLDKEEQTIRYIPEKQKWFRVFKASSFEDGQSVIIDYDTSEVLGIQDDREYLFPQEAKISGTVHGRGNLAGALVQSTAVEALSLKDLEVSLNHQRLTYTNEAGEFSFLRALSGQIDISLIGKWASVSNLAGTPLTFQGEASVGHPLSIELNPDLGFFDEFSLAQINGYYHTTFIHDWAKERLPSLAALDIQTPVRVNWDYTCNAFYDINDNSINFFRSGILPLVDNNLIECPNTASDTIVDHEYGHFIDVTAGGGVDTGIGHGWQDSVAILATGQSYVGQGIFFGYDADEDILYPSDNVDSAEDKRRSYAGFVWDLRENLSNLYGEQGVRYAEDLIMTSVLANPTSVPNAVYQVFLLDDDDGILDNGTPRFVPIATAANKHGFYPFLNLAVANITSPQINSLLNTFPNPLVIRGTARTAPVGLTFLQYNLSYGVGKNPSQWIPLASRTQPVDFGDLGTWDTSNLSEGTYTLRLLVKSTIPLLRYQFLATVFINSKITPIKITTLNDETKPVISGDKVVYISTGQSVVMQDLNSGSTQTLSQGPGLIGNVAISANFVAWTQKDFFSPLLDKFEKIYLYRIGPGTRTVIVNNPVGLKNVAISGHRIVWQDFRNGQWDIYFYDINTATEQAVITHPANQESPSIDGDKVVYTDDRDGNRDIYLWDFSSPPEERITSNSSEQITPKISNDKIVWVDFRNGNLDIYGYNLSSQREFPIKVDTNDQVDPDISGDMVVWADNPDGLYFTFLSGTRADIHYFDLLTGREHTIPASEDTGELHPAIDGNKVIFESTMGGRTWPNIFMYKIPKIR